MKRRVTLIATTLLLGGVVLYVRSAIAQTDPLQVIPLAQGFSPEHEIELHAKGPSVVLQAKLVLAPLGEIGWHTHPGPVIMVGTQGALTEYHSNGCVSVHQAGSFFVEEPGEVHRVVNHSGSVAAEGYATFILPAGAPPLLPAPEPRAKACAPGQGKKD